MAPQPSPARGILGRVAAPPQRSKQLAKDFKAPEVITGFLIQGGLAKKPQWVPVVEFEGQQFAKLHATEPWLCHVAAGKAAGLNPLSRTSLIKHLRALMDEHPSLQEASAPEAFGPQLNQDAMEELDLDGTAGAHMGTSTRCNKKAKTNSKPRPSRVVHLVISQALRGIAISEEGALAPAGPDQIAVLTRPPKMALRKGQVWVAIGHVPWIVAVLYEQVRGGGVHFEPDATVLAKPYWSRRDSSWQARGKRPDGDVVRKTFKVAGTVRLGDGRKGIMAKSEFQKQKTLVYKVALQWMQDVADGTGGDDSGGAVGPSSCRSSAVES